MATQYSVVFEAFLNKISDDDLLSINKANRNLILLGLMRSACAEFKNLCVEDLSKRDDTTSEFEEDLSDESIEILAKLMVVEWLGQKVRKNDWFEIALGTKFSPAEQLKQTRETYNEAKKDAKKSMIDYSFIHKK